MMKTYIKICCFTILFSLCFTTSSCKKERKLTASASVPAQSNTTKSPQKIKKLTPAAKAFIEGKTLAVVLGYDYNDPDSITKIIESLNTNFGVATEETPALISVLIYPNDFMVGGKARVSSLANLIEDKTLCGMIILGAPEGMHNTLAKLQDKSETGELNYPVISIFPQDDVLGTESTSDFVIDYAHKANTDDVQNAESANLIPDFEITAFLTNVIQAILEVQTPISADENLYPFVQKLFGSKRTLTNYIDGETGLKSINHFVFE